MVFWGKSMVTVETSSYSGDIHDVFSGFESDRFLKSALSELLFGNGDVDIATGIRNDNFSVVEHVHSINSVQKAEC